MPELTPWGQPAYTDAEVAAFGLEVTDRTMCRIVRCTCKATVDGRRRAEPSGEARGKKGKRWGFYERVGHSRGPFSVEEWILSGGPSGVHPLKRHMLYP